VTRLTSDERRAIQAELDQARAEIVRLQALLDSQPEGSDGDTIRMLQPLCSCGLPRDHRHPVSGEPRPCADETARIALDEGRRGRPPVPGSVTRDESRPMLPPGMSPRAAEAIADLIDLDRELRGDLEDGDR
jgi:hypothetical protein